MSWRKRQLQRLGSWVVRQVSNTTVPDTTSGFRAYTREAALRMTIVSEFSYTLETIIQAGKKRMAIAHVPMTTNPRTRAVAAVRQHVLVHQAIGGDHRPHLRDVRTAEGVLLHRLAHRPARRRCSPCGSSTTYLTEPLASGRNLQSLMLAAGADDRRLPGAPERTARRRDFGQPQAARGSRLPRALARTAAASRRRDERTADVISPGAERRWPR